MLRISGVRHEYYRDKARQVLVRRVDPSRTEWPGTVRSLQRDGVAVVPNFVGAAELAAINDEVRSQEAFLAGRVGDNVVKRNGRYLLLDPAPRMQVARAAFFENEALANLCRAYLSPRAQPSRPAVQLKRDVAEPSIVDFFHIDEWRYLISAFLYLGDVGSEQAPMVYLKGSHRFRPWRIRKEQEFYYFYGRDSLGSYANEESPYCGCVLPTEVRRIRERYGFEPMECTGPAGTLLVFDNLGLHRATPLRSGSRLLLSTYWTIP